MAFNSSAPVRRFRSPPRLACSSPAERFFLPPGSVWPSPLDRPTRDDGHVHGVRARSPGRVRFLIRSTPTLPWAKLCLRYFARFMQKMTDAVHVRWDYNGLSRLVYGRLLIGQLLSMPP